MLITDNPSSVPYVPLNVRLMHASLGELRARFSDALGMKIVLNHGFKLCDYRPAFGVIFSSELKGFTFWGHTDLDMFYGNLTKFLPDERLDQYVRLFHRGHLSLFRNDEHGNNLFRLPHPTVDWKRAFSTDKACYFDETGGIEALMSFNNVPEYEDNLAFADIVPRSPTLRLTRSQLNRRHQIFIYENGKVLQLYEDHGTIARREFMYLHLQKRNMPSVPASLWRHCSSWICTPAAFLPEISENWRLTDLRKYNRPSYSHAVRYGCARLARRFTPAQRLRTS